MRHVEKALVAMKESNELSKFIELENADDVSGIAPVVKFTVQSDPVSAVGVNGLQAVDMLEYVKNLFKSLNDTFPCRENSITITKIEEAIFWQEARTRDRMKRGVEGQNKN
jgi:hypothetical protein